MKVYLKTSEVHDGLFSSEKSVRIRDFTGEETSGFFERDYIKNGGLEVTVISEKDNFVLVKLPGRTLEGAGEKGYMTVNKEQLEYSTSL